MPRLPSPLPPPPDAATADAFVAHFADLDDPRRHAHKVRYPLALLLLIVYAAMLSGLTGWDAFAEFAALRRDWLRARVPFDGAATPCADTIRTVFERLRPDAFTACFTRWTASLADVVAGRHLALDGKNLVGAFDAATPTLPLHLLHVWLVDQTLLLAAVPTTAGATGEPAAITQALATLDVEGAVVTADAMNATREVADAIRAGGGQYVLALKANRGPAHAAAAAFFAPRTAHVGGAFDAADGVRADRDVTRGHGRVELRQAWAVAADRIPAVGAWLPHAQAVLCVERSRRVGAGPVTVETQYYVSSLPPQVVRLAGFVRRHWSIENDCHRVLDVVLHEDATPIRRGPGAQNLAIVRRHVATVLRRDDAVTGSLPKKMRRAAFDDDYRAHLLTLAVS